MDASFPSPCPYTLTSIYSAAKSYRFYCHSSFTSVLFSSVSVGTSMFQTHITSTWTVLIAIYLLPQMQSMGIGSVFIDINGLFSSQFQSSTVHWLNKTQALGQLSQIPRPSHRAPAWLRPPTMKQDGYGKLRHRVPIAQHPRAERSQPLSARNLNTWPSPSAMAGFSSWPLVSLIWASHNHGKRRRPINMPAPTPGKIQASDIWIGSRIL